MKNFSTIPTAEGVVQIPRGSFWPGGRKKNWHAMRADPEFQEVIKSEQANKLVEKVDLTYMRPTDFSPIKWCGIWHSATISIG
jgi:NIPSNAP